jgi:DnaJ-class molecular chaperone
MNHYEVLGVGPDATEREIKEAYRVEAMKWHPDRHSGAAAKGEADRRFKDLAVAYRTLRNAVERANYDRQLEQQLHREYNNRQQADAKQQERTRQEHAQQEHARAQAAQKEARQDPPKADFANTGPQFEEASASDDDANQMFYEQMLDIATDFAGRGFPEFNIFKALVGLGCPEALAKVVAAAAAKQSQQRSSKSANFSQPQANSSDDKVDASTELLDYYKAAIGPDNQDFFLRKFKKFDQSGSAGFSWPGAGRFSAGMLKTTVRQWRSTT